MDTQTGQISGVYLAIIGSAVTAFSTSLGALPAVAIKRISERTQDILMGFSAGVMLAATCFSLITPALELALQAAVPKIKSGALVALSVVLGGLFLHLCNKYIPHEHFIKGREGGPSVIHLKRIWLFVLAITLHNFPEGLAVGSGVGSMDLSVARPILVGIALQDIPEGFVVAMALVGVQYSRRWGLLVAVITGLVEAAAAMLGFLATYQVQGILAWTLAFSGGAMLYVISDEMIPESHRKEFAKEATAGLMLGFVLMMFLDTSLS